MKNAKRIIVGLIVFCIAMIIFCITVNFFKEKEYKYMNFDNEWGVSSKCYLDEDQFAVCKFEEELIIVRQFYEV